MNLKVFAILLATATLCASSFHAVAQGIVTGQVAQSSSAQSTRKDELVSSTALEDLPDAPDFVEAQNTSPPKDASQAPPFTPTTPPVGPVPPWMTKTRLTLSDKFTVYTHQTFGPPALVFPALGAGIRMANPPKHYPRDWTDGGGAFGRLYGNALATQTSKRTAEFLTEAAFHEDPRYLPAAPG